MSKYFLYSREENGYHDSYFYDVFFNAESGKIEEVMTHATAWAGPNQNMPEYSPMTDEALKNAKKAMIRECYEGMLRRAESMTNFRQGETVVAKRNFRHKGKSYSKGLEGTVFWSGRFHRSQEYANVGIKTSEGTVFTSAKNLAPKMSKFEMLKVAIQSTNNWFQSAQKKGA